MIFTNWTNGARRNLWVVYWHSIEGRHGKDAGLRAGECFFMVPGTWDLE